ncbi:MAG: SDR family NAD(P)-dependent oxidoreductase [Minisyncoccia bacterium]
MDLTNKTIVITGGSSGLGYCLAKAFKKFTDKIVICSNNQDVFDRANELNISASVNDVTKIEDVKKLLDFVLQKFGVIDIWINNAGIWMPHCSIEDLDFEKVKKVFDVNTFGLMYGSQVAFRQMKKQGNGVIINIISVSGIEPHIGSSGYCASKFAANGFTKVLRLEAQQIKVISIYPAGMKTNLFKDSLPEDYNNYLEPDYVAQKIIQNLILENPVEELVIRN